MQQQSKAVDVFVSYCHEDRNEASAIIDRYRGAGFQVRWDEDFLAGGRIPDDVISSLTASKCVIVLWSEASIFSDWVFGEADEARKAGKLIQVLLSDHVAPKISYQFRSGKTIAQGDWPALDRAVAHHSNRTSGMVDTETHSKPYPTRTIDDFIGFMSMQRNKRPAILIANGFLLLLAGVTFAIVDSSAVAGGMLILSLALLFWVKIRG